MQKTDRLQREQKFYDERFGEAEHAREKAKKYYSINETMMNRYEEIVAGLCKDKELLEYGCGAGSSSQAWLKLGAKLTGIDISPEGVKKAKDSVKEAGYNAEYFVMDAENTDFADNRFDVIVGSAIIHHLDLLSCYSELSRILNKNGHAVFIEPLGHNPIINLYRLLTPKMRTDDEHPMRQEDLNRLSEYFNNVDFEYFYLLTLLAVPFRKFFFFDKLCSLLQTVDNLIFSIPFMRKNAWMVIIHAYNPKNS